MAAGHWRAQIAMQATFPEEEKLKQKGDSYITRGQTYALPSTHNLASLNAGPAWP